VDKKRILNREMCVIQCVCMYVRKTNCIANVPNFDHESSYSYFWMKRSFLESYITRAIFTLLYSEPVAPTLVAANSEQRLYYTCRLYMSNVEYITKDTYVHETIQICSNQKVDCFQVSRESCRLQIFLRVINNK